MNSMAMLSLTAAGVVDIHHLVEDVLYRYLHSYPPVARCRLKSFLVTDHIFAREGCCTAPSACECDRQLSIADAGQRIHLRYRGYSEHQRRCTSNRFEDVVLVHAA